MTLCELFDARVCSNPHAVAVHYKDVDYSYGDISRAADETAGWLVAQGLSRGERVVLMMRNCAEYVASYLGILKAGGVVVALNPQLPLPELEMILADCEPTAAFVEPQRAREVAQCARSDARIRAALKYLLTVAGITDIESCGDPAGDSLSAPSPGVDVRGDDLAQIIYTSGTTGKPKGVVLTHDNVVSNCRSIIEYLSLTADDSVLVILPFFYSYGNSLLFTHLACGGRLILASDFVFWNRVLDLMEAEGATGLAGVPSTFAMLLHKSDFRRRSFLSLRYMTCAGGRLPPAHVDELTAAVPHAELFLMYGQTEATARLSTLLPDELPGKSGSIGRGIPGVLLRVLNDDGEDVPPGEVGEIVASGPNVMAGYWNDPELTATVLCPQGLRTGDLAYRDDEGYLYIVGRKDDMIKSGAHRIFPSDVEDAISRLDEVSEVAVVGVPDEILYQKPVAFVVPSSRAGACDPERILQLCRDVLPAYKRPREVHIVDALPKTASGKVKRSAVRELVSASPMSEAEV